MLSEIDYLAPTTHEVRGGLRRGDAIILALLALIGAVASTLLLRTGITHQLDHSGELSCDINPLIGCSSSLLAPQSHLFGIPNAAIGMIGFGVLTGIACVVVAGRQLPRWLWYCLAAGAAGGLVWIVWFLYLSLTLFRALCPYCLVVWTVTIPIAMLIATYLLRTCHWGSPSGFSRLVLQVRWLIVVVIYAMIVATVVVALSDKVALIL